MLVQLIRPPAAQRKWLQVMSAPGLPLGLAYIAGAIETAGHRVSVLDAFYEGSDNWMPYGRVVARGIPNRETVERIDPAADVIGITIMFSVDWLIVVDLVRRLRERWPEKTIVLGGEHVTALPDFSLRTSEADILVLGEGEQTIADLLSTLERGGDLEKVEGIAFRRGERIVHTERRTRIGDLDSIARPAWHHFEVRGYTERRISGVGFYNGEISVPVLASRGCPYECTFCSAPIMWSKWRARDAVAVVDELESHMRELGATTFHFYDLTTIIRRSFVEDLCREILRRGLKIQWQLVSGTRMEAVDRDLARLLKQSGLTYVGFAPETGSDETRERIKKKLKSEVLERATRAAIAEGLRVQYFMVTGFPDDTHADLRSSVRLAWWAGKVGVSDIGPGVFTPIPGTELFDELLESGAIEFSEPLLFATITNFGFFPRFVCTKNLSSFSVAAYVYAITASFYASRAFHRPRQFFGEIFATAASPTDSGLFGKLLKGLFGTVRRIVTGGFSAEKMTWPEIDFRSVGADDLLRFKKVGAARLAPPARPERTNARAPGEASGLPLPRVAHETLPATSEP